jgi:hypothetical protein
VKDRDDITGILRLAEYQDVGKAGNQDPASLMRPGWKLLRVGRDSRYGGPKRFPKQRDDVRRMRIIPIDRLGEVGAGGIGKEDARHSSCLLDKLRVNALPRDGGLGVVVEGDDAAIKLARLGGRQLNLLGVEAVPQLTDEVETFFRAQARNVERGHLFKVACLQR